MASCEHWKSGRPQGKSVQLIYFLSLRNTSNCSSERHFNQNGITYSILKGYIDSRLRPTNFSCFIISKLLYYGSNRLSVFSLKHITYQVTSILPCHLSSLLHLSKLKNISWKVWESILSVIYLLLQFTHVTVSFLLFFFISVSFWPRRYVCKT